MNLSGSLAVDNIEILHQRYAKALFDFASKHFIIDKIMQDLTALTNIIRSNDNISQILKHPEISKDEKIRVLEEISKKNKFCEDFIDFLKVLVQKRRWDLIAGIFLCYQDYYDEKRRRTKVFVRSAIELKSGQKDKLLKQLCMCLKEEVTLDIKIDQSLIGGLFVKIHDRMYDTSVAGMLHDINARLTG